MTPTETRSLRSATFSIDPSDEELARDWTLTAADLVEVRRCRGSSRRHSFALQLCTLRRFGRFLGEDFSTVPVRIVNHIGVQVGLQPVLFLSPPNREATDLDHEERIRKYLGFIFFDSEQRAALESWLGERAAEGLIAEELFSRAEGHLHQKRVLQPGWSVLERLVNSAATRADEGTLVRIHNRLSPALRAAIDDVLKIPEGARQSIIFRLKEYPPSPTPDVMCSYLERAEMLRTIGVAGIDFAGIRPEVVRRLAQMTRRYDVQKLRRFAAPKRHSMIACFLAEANKSVLDHLVEMHHVFLTGLQRRALHALDKQHRELRQVAARNLRLVLCTLEALLDSGRSADDVRQNVDLPAVRAAISGCRALEELTDGGQLKELRARHHLLKRYLPRFLCLPFAGEPGAEPLLAAIVRARELHAGDRDVLGADAPTGFAVGVFRQALKVPDGVTPDLRTWELALAFAVRDALRSGDLYLADSRHHLSFWNLVQPEAEWVEHREKAYAGLNLPTDADRALTRLRDDFNVAAEAFARGLGDNTFARLENGELALSRRDALEIPAGVHELRRVVETHLPRVRIEDLLVEVDSWCHFTRELLPVGGYAPRLENPYMTLLAAVLAHGTNLGTATMAQSTKGVSVDTLQYASQWFLRPETLKAANRALVDFHHRLELAATWGDGGSSSSDGQRFGVQESSLLAGFYPRYFGFYDRAINVYTHISDQFSVFAARAISCSPREAIYVLDGLLENDTVLRPREHYTDTHGFTEQLFGLCHLLGFSFMPRLKDLTDQQLYKLDRDRSFGAIDPLFRGSINVALVGEQWDQLVRVAASLKSRTAPAHVVLDRLAAAGAPSDRLAKALTMLGRVVKTIHILRYLHDARVRDRIQLQLNRGESRHALARRLFFANQGAFRSGDYEEIMNKVSCLSILSNAVLVWNTVRITSIVKGLETTTGTPVDRTQLARISPLAHAHVIPSGTYHFDRVGKHQIGGGVTVSGQKTPDFPSPASLP